MFVPLLHGNHSPAALSATKASLSFLRWLQQPLLGLPWPSGWAGKPVLSQQQHQGEGKTSTQSELFLYWVTDSAPGCKKLVPGVVNFEMYLLLRRRVCTSTSWVSVACDEKGAQISDFHCLFWKLTFRLKGNPSCLFHTSRCGRMFPCTFTPPSVLRLLMEGENKQEQRSDLPYAPFLPKAQVAPVVLGDPAK